MTEDTGTATDETSNRVAGSEVGSDVRRDVGERRRAIRAERAQAQTSSDDPPPPPPAGTSLVRPYVHAAAPDDLADVAADEEIDREPAHRPAGTGPPVPAEPPADSDDHEDGAGPDALEPTPIMPTTADGWDAISLREEDDDTWVQTLREQDDDSWLRILRNEDDAPAPSGHGPRVDGAPKHDAAQLTSLESQSDESPIPLLPLEAIPEDEAATSAEDVAEDSAQNPAEDAAEDPAENPADNPVENPAEDADTASRQAQPRGFRRPPAERLNRALTDESGFFSQQGEPRGEERIRGTLEPVLRHSTERAKVTPVLRPPVPPADGDARVAVRRAPTSWDDAITGDVLPGKKKRRRRLARARHESAGAEEEYRPPSSSDRSLTLLVVAMLAVLAVLVGVGLWTFWPR